VLVRRVDEHAVDVEHRAVKTRSLDHVTERARGDRPPDRASHPSALHGTRDVLA
jgi:hypothetical protein